MADQNPIIDLDKVQHATVLSSSALLHPSQLDIFYERVRTIGQHIPTFKKQLESHTPTESTAVGYERYHDVITIHGKRGSGKTTFLLSALNALRKGEHRNSTEAMPKNPYVLDIVDPTLFGLHDHLLHTLLGKIAREVREHARTRAIALCDASSECLLEKWEQSLSRLAKGLKYAGETRDDLKSPPPPEPVDWMDAEFLMEKSMDTACHGVDLERAFHRFLNLSLTILGRDAFVLGLDDIDTRPSIGWHVLEVLRRYFTSPQLIVVISGDMDLFRALIEKQQLSIFGLDFTSRPEVLREFQPRVDNLTEQYLLKILRTPNRIGLGYFQTALEQVYAEKSSVSIQYTELPKKDTEEQKVSRLPLEDFLKKYFYPLFPSAAAPEQRLFRLTLFSNPMRSVVQVLYGLTRTGKKRAGQHLCDVFFVALQRMGFPQPDNLAESLATPGGLALLMRQLFTRGYVTRGLELLPKRGADEENNALLVLHAELVHAMSKNVTVLFSYLVKACLLREILFAQFPDVQEQKYRTIEDFLKIGSEESLCTTCERISVFYRGNIITKDNIKYPGIIRLYKSTEKITDKIINDPNMILPSGEINSQKLKKDVPELYGFYRIAQNSTSRTSSKRAALFDTPDDLQKNVLSWQKSIVTLGIIDIRDEGSNLRIFSIFPLLGILGDILENHGSLFRVLTQGNGIHRYTVYNEKNNEKNESTQAIEEADEVIDPEDNDYHQNNDGLTSLLSTWSNTYVDNNKLLFSPILCSRAMKRFFVSLKNINNKIHNKATFIGMYIHRCLIAFFNSILIEEYLLSHGEKAGLRSPLKNSIQNDAAFLDNLNAIYQELDIHAGNLQTQLNEKLPLFALVFSCPLWGLYLKAVDENGQEITNEAYARYLELQGDTRELLKKACAVTYSNAKEPFANLYYVLNSIPIITPKK